MKQHWIAITIVVIAGVSWFGRREYRCKLRAAAFAGQVESITRDAAKELKVGTNQADVSRFFAEHNIPFETVGSEVFGNLETSGCAPFGCGTDKAFIGVDVKLDGSGNVSEVPRVVGMYRDCL